MLPRNQESRNGYAWLVLWVWIEFLGGQGVCNALCALCHLFLSTPEGGNGRVEFRLDVNVKMDQKCGH